MQNWNQWQLSAGAVTTPMPQPPVGYAAPGTDPMAMMQAYMQYYNQPAPSGYTPEQWAAAQQQNWVQWQQWQQQYQQWQAQYGEKYQETMKHMSAQSIGLANQAPPLPNVQPPPLPKEDAKPPLPPSTMNMYQFTSMPPPNQNNLPLFPVKPPANNAAQTNTQNCPPNPPLPTSQPPLPPESSTSSSSSNSSSKENISSGKRDSSTVSEPSSAKKLKTEDEDLTEAEKTFDAQFKQWEEQFNKWKQQNANHPDKTQYKQYEAKWTSWREKLIERREQMRRKREQQKQAAAKAEAEKNKNIPGDDKILNILSNTENQGLINNLLGIGKTLGLTGKQSTNVPPPPPPPPPPPTQTTVSDVQSTTTSSSQMTSQSPVSQSSGLNVTSTVTSSPWNPQQWQSQYNSGISMPSFPNFQSMSSVPPPPFGAPPHQMPPPNFTQPPPNFPSLPNFSQPPPGFGVNDARQSQDQNVRLPFQPNLQTRPPFGPNNATGPDMNSLRPNERSNQSGPISNFESVGQPNSFGRNDNNRQRDAGTTERFGQDNIGKSFSDQPGNQFRPSDTFLSRGDSYKLSDERMPENEQFRREDRNYQDSGNNQFNSQKMNFNLGNERFLPGGDRFGQGNDRFGSGGERFAPGNNRFSSGPDRFGPGNDRCGLLNDRSDSGNDRFGCGSDRFGPGSNRFGPDDRFGSGNDRFSQGTDRGEHNNDRFSANSERFGPSSEQYCNERFNRNNLDRFDQKDTNDNRRDSFINNSRGFNRNSHFEPSDGLAPELKKLMEKRKAAMDVFKPSFLESDKNSSVGSLSESFKKIAGDSPFGMKGCNDFGQKEYGGAKGNSNSGPRGLGNFGPTESGNFRMPGIDFRPRESEFKPQGGPDFGPRAPLGFRGPIDSFSRDAPSSVELDQRSGKDFDHRVSSSPQHTQDFTKTSSKIDMKNPEMEVSLDAENQSGDSIKEANKNREHTDGVCKGELTINEEGNENTKPNDSSQDYPSKGEIPLIEKPPWVDAMEISEHNVAQKDNSSNKEDAKTDQNTQIVDSEGSNISGGDKKDATSNDDSIIKKSEALPFMGENDPKPEDLNMEPPPELPNLGPVTTENIKSNNEMPRIDQPFDSKMSSLRPFPGPPECFDPRGAFDGPFGPRGMPFRPHAPPLFGPRGPNDGRFSGFEPRDSNPFPFPPPGPNPHQLGPRMPNDGQFSPRGSNDGQFCPRGPGNEQFGPQGPNEGSFGPRGPNDGQFSVRGPNDQFGAQTANRQFGPNRPNEGPFDNRGIGDTQFNTRGPTDGQFGFSGPLGSRRPNSALADQRVSNDNAFGSRGLNDGQFAQRGLKDGPFVPRGFNDRQFDTQGPTDEYFGRLNTSDRYFGPRGPIAGPNDGLFASRNRDGQFNNRAPFGVRGLGEFRPRGQFDNASPKMLRDISKVDTSRIDDFSEKHLDRNNEVGGSDICGDGGRDLDKSTLDVTDKMRMEQNMEQTQSFGPSEMQMSEWKQPYSKNSFGDIDQRTGRDPGYIEKSQHNQSDIHHHGSTRSSMDHRSLFMTRSEKNMMDSGAVSSTADFKSGYGESSSVSDYTKFGSPNTFMKRPIDNRQSQVRCPVGKEFCIEKQFNYNHGGATIEKKLIEYTPVKVIDYAHTSRSPIQDHLTPVQCFDYGHGNLKPVVPDREVYPKKDFRHWEENEQNLREYTERMRRYEYFAGKKDSRRSIDYRQRRDSEGLTDDRKFERDKREKEDYRPKDRGEERLFDRMSDKDQDDRYQNDRSNNKERMPDRRDASQKETKKENDKDEDRSKGNINWQDSTNKNVTETKPQETSIPDVQHNVLEPPPKTLDLGKTPNCTMVDDLLCPPGRQNRPPKIAIILRGPPGSGKSFVAKLIKDKEVEQGGSAPRILSLDDYFLVEKEIESKDDNGKKVTVKEMVYEYEEAMEQSYVTSLVKAFKKNITDGFFNFIILDCINEKISDYEEMWSFAKTKGFKVYVCEMEMDLQICLKRNIHNRTEEEINRIIDYFEPTPSYHQKLDVNSMLQEQAIEEVHMEDSQETQEEASQLNEDSQDSQEDAQDSIGVSKWERMEAEDKLDRLDGLAKKKNEGKVQTMKDFLQVPDYYNMEDTSGKKRVRWADLEERKEQEKMRAVGFVVGHTNWDRMMDPTKGGSALTRTKFFSLS